MAEDSIWVLVPAGQRASGEWIDDTLSQRVEEKGLGGKLSLAGRFPRQRVEVVRDADPTRAINELYYRRGWTDGLPVVPPTLGRVEDMLRFTDMAPAAVVAELDPLKGQASVERIAANAVMAGCESEHLPVVLAAVAAIAEPEFNLRGVQTTDENVAPLIIVNGPVARDLDINSGFGALGPGWRANAAIGRALRMVMNNIGGGWPGAVSFAGLGQPARYTLCLAENADQSPWQPLHVELGFDTKVSTVTAGRAETVINVTGGLADLASVMGSAASLFAMLHNGKVTVLLAPFVAGEMARDGWTKDDVKTYLHEHGRMPAEAWRASWLHERIVEPGKWPDWVRESAAQGAIPPVRAPDDITVVIAGGDIPIPQNAYLPSWGFPPCRVTKEITLPRDWAARFPRDSDRTIPQ